jgi:hypothetical protein
VGLEAYDGRSGFADGDGFRARSTSRWTCGRRAGTADVYWVCASGW